MARQRTTQHGGALQHEITGTLALLTDEEDFAAMRRYRSFAFAEHGHYLDEADQCLKTLAAQGRHTTLTLFDPEEYAEFCADTELDPDRQASRHLFTAHLAETGPTVAYEGQPLGRLLPQLIDTAVRRATFAYASDLLGRAGECAGCGEGLGRAAFDHAARLLVAALGTLGPGAHHLVCSASLEPGALLADLDARVDEDGSFHLDETEALDLTTVLAAALATEAPSGLVARTTHPGQRDSVCGWRLRERGLRPLTAAEVFDAYCTDVDTGDLIPPEPGVEYRAAAALLHPEQDHDHEGPGEY